MPIWFELIVLMLVAYCVGIGIGWLLWSASDSTQPNGTDTEED